MKQHAAELRKKLSATEDRYKELYEKSPDMYISVSPVDAGIIDCNQTLADKTGYTKEEILEQDIFFMYHPDCMPHVKEAFKSFVETGRVNNMELAVKKKDGTKIPVLLSVETVRDANGTPIYSNSCWRDITERKKLEKQLEEQIIQLKIYQAKLEKDYAMKNRLISMIGHDIITPLRFMSYAGKQLIEQKDKISAESYADTIRIIVDTSNNLRDMSANMLDWIKHHSENTGLSPELLYLHETVQYVVDNVTPMSKFNENIIVNQTGPDIVLNQYKEPLKNIFLQLLSNAIKYCKRSEIIITAKRNAKMVTVTVSDNGPGMSTEQVQDLTYAKMPDANTNTDENKGHGFGYLIIRDMLAIIDGEIAIDSKLKKGTSVHISFPSHLV